MRPLPVPVPDSTDLALDTLAQGLDAPVDAVRLAGDGRLFVVERVGRIRIIRDDVLEPTPFLDIRDRVRSGNEQGLLGLAFPADFATSGRFFVHYTRDDGGTRLSRFSVSANPDVADPDSESIYLEEPQPFANHNGGQVAFGPDGHLYLALGDGGSANDPQGHGQNPGTLLGTLVRLDVSTDPPYAVPADNPFVGDSTRRPEIWAWGLRNPWRFSFDEGSGLLFIADVGQNRWEEVNAVDLSAGGINYGWNVREGPECFNTSGCSDDGLTDPVVSYDHGDGCSITGGYVYRGSALPDLIGRYVFSDYCTGWIRAFDPTPGASDPLIELDLPRLSQVTSFGRDGDELVVLTETGLVMRIVPPA